MVQYLKKIAKIISSKGGLLFIFLRAQLSSQFASITDFAVSYFSNRFFDTFFQSLFGEFGYVFATGLGATCGGIINCIVNYRWTFKVAGMSRKAVVIKYTIVWMGSLILNMYGTYLLTEYLRDSQWVYDVFGRFTENAFLVPKLIVSLIVGFIWNFNMQRLFVYKDVNIKGIFKRKDK